MAKKSKEVLQQNRAIPSVGSKKGLSQFRSVVDMASAPAKAGNARVSKTVVTGAGQINKVCLLLVYHLAEHLQWLL